MTPARPASITDHLRTEPSHSPSMRRRPTGDDRVAPLSARRTPRPDHLRGPRTITRIGAGAVAAAALVAGTVTLDASGAGAAAVPYAVGFEDSVPAIAPGGETQMYLDCPGNAAAPVPVTVTSPSGAISTHDVATVDTSGTPRVFVTVGDGGTFTANELGTWSVDVTCVGFDPFVSTFEVLAPALAVTTRLDRDYDCTTDDAAFLPGDRERVCVTVTNNTGKDLRRIGTVMDGASNYDYPAAGEVGPGESVTTAVSAGHATAFGGGSIEGIRVWAELDASGSGLFAVSETRSQAYAPLGAPLALTATTGLDASTACAADGGLSHRTVAPGTPVYLCYTVTNTSGVTYHFHDIDDSVLGSLYTGLENDLATFESMSWRPTQPVVVTSGQIHTGTWSSTLDDPEGYSALPAGYVAVAQATAAISVTAAPAPPTPAPTPTTPTSVPVVVPIVVAATPVVVTPQLAG